MSDQNPKDHAKAMLYMDMKQANEILSPHEIAEQVYDALGEGGTIALQGQLVLQVTTEK